MLLFVRVLTIKLMAPEESRRDQGTEHSPISSQALSLPKSNINRTH